MYEVALKSGFLSTSIGNRLFEFSYHLYKDWLEAQAVNRLRPWIRDGASIIDVGANAGFFTRRFAKWITGNGVVFAIEPELKNIERLERALREDNITDRVCVIEAVAVERAGTLMLAVNPTHPGDHRISNVGEPVNAVTLDDVVSEQGWPEISLIKVDVQGAEVRVLDGAKEILRRCRPALFLEIDPSALEEQNSSVVELVERLRNARYWAYALNQNKDFKPFPLDDIASMMKLDSHYIDVLCLPEESDISNKIAAK